MAAAHRLLRALVAIALIGGLLFGLYAWTKSRPQDMPWTTLDLAQPIGLFTGRKLTALTGDAPLCRSLLDQAGVDYTALPPRGDGQCGYDDAVRFADGGARGIDFVPAGLGVACSVAAALALWEWHVVQPAARRHFGSEVASIDHFGSFSCRRLYGRSEGAWSEHATADAVDIAGFRLADGRRVTVIRDWNGNADEQAFLREVRDGACDLFATVLSPDYNAAHRDHFHFDQAERGVAGWRGCR
jgi:hypothetical protein